MQERKNVITHAQSILEGITAAHLALAGDEDGEQSGAADLLGGAVDGLQNSARLDETLAPMSERLNDLYYSARELATDLADRLDAYGFDTGGLDQIESRLDTILPYQAEVRHGGRRTAGPARSRRRRAGDLPVLRPENCRTESPDADAVRRCEGGRRKLTQSRLKGFAAMNKEMKAALEFLNMPGIRFALKHARGRCPPMGRTRWNF